MSSRALALLFLCGCGGSTENGLSFSSDPFTTLTTSKGLAVQVWTSPQTPTRGQLAVKFGFSGSEGQSLSATVTPFMPTMGHGSAPISADAEFVAEGINLYMAGAWELRTSVGGDVTDEFVVELSIP